MNQLTEQAAELLAEENMELFNNIDEYVKYLFEQTNFHDGMVMLKALANKIDGYILTQDAFQFVADTDNIYIDIEDYFDALDFEGEIWE